MGDIKPILLERDGQQAKFHGSWYRGEQTNFIASKADLQREDAVLRYILEGWTPAVPFITKGALITAFGSCFAHHISLHLTKEGYNISSKKLTLQSHLVRFGEGLVNSFSILQQFEWALENKDFPNDLWFSEQKDIAPIEPEIRAETKRLLNETDIFIITLGVSEIWYDKISGEALWRAVPGHLFDPERHAFRVSTVEENRNNILRICAMIKASRPTAKVILTLSPVPLMATFRPISCITASSVSKAILRVALDEVMREIGGEDVLYFPSYEIVKDYFVDPYKEDNRHPTDQVINFVMQQFEKHYCI